MGVLEAVLNVFTGVGEWIPDAITAMIPIFWTAGTDGGGTLTFMGVLAVAGLAFSVVFLKFFKNLYFKILNTGRHNGDVMLDLL